MQVFSDKALDMTSVTWYILLSHFIVRPSDPVLGEPGAVSKYLFIFVKLVRKFI
jgi:hypothetical protein